MVSQINGMKQANANAQQANNLLQTAESGMSDISDVLGRMRELAVQASTDTLNDEDRDSIDLEFQAHGDEITRIASATEYDDNALLDGTYSGKKLQIGADNDANHQLTLSIGSVTETGLKLNTAGGFGAVTGVGTTTTDTNYVAAVAAHDANVDTVDHARDAISGLDAAIDTVNHERSEIGAMQNRLSFTISNLSNHTQALEAGRSAIADVDFAAEATALARNQILAQSGTAMLAQASAVSQNVLGLLI
jgi:flagellin